MLRVLHASFIHTFSYLVIKRKRRKKRERKKERKKERQKENYSFTNVVVFFLFPILIIFIFCDVCVCVCVFFLFVEIQSSIFFSSSPLFLCYVKWSYLRTECTLQMKKILKIYKLNNVFLLIFNRA